MPSDANFTDPKSRSTSGQETCHRSSWLLAPRFQYMDKEVRGLPSAAPDPTGDEAHRQCPWLKVSICFYTSAASRVRDPSHLPPTACLDGHTCSTPLNGEPRTELPKSQLPPKRVGWTPPSSLLLSKQFERGVLSVRYQGGSCQCTSRGLNGQPFRRYRVSVSNLFSEVTVL